MSDTRLFGVPGAETLYLDLADAYEAQVDPWVDEHDRRPREIEEWSVQPKRRVLPDAQTVIDWILEHAADNEAIISEDHYDHAAGAAPHEAIEAALSAWASAIRYECADKLLATHTITWDEAGEPLVDGAPLYAPRPDSQGDET